MNYVEAINIYEKHRKKRKRHLLVRFNAVHRIKSYDPQQ